MSQLLASQSKIKRNKVELRIEQKYQIIEYWQKHPSIKQTEMIKYFNKLFSVNIPATTMSGILSVESRNKILKQDNVELMLGISEGSSFMYSDGWLARFKKRHNLQLYKIVGESGSVSVELIAKSRKEVREYILNWIKKGGKLENIFNLDETALFFKLQRSETLASLGQFFRNTQN